MTVESIRRLSARVQMAEEIAASLLMSSAAPARLEFLSAEVARRAAVVDQARTETPWTPTLAGTNAVTSTTIALYSVLEDLHAGRIW